MLVCGNLLHMYALFFSKGKGSVLIIGSTMAITVFVVSRKIGEEISVLQCAECLPKKAFTLSIALKVL